MIRTVWIPAFCLAVLGGLFATRVTASMPSTEQAVPDPTEINAKLVQNTLTKADKLDVSYRSVETVPVLPMESIAVTTTKSRPNRNGRSQHLSGPNANRASVMPPKPRPKIRLAKNNNAAKTTPDSKTCPQPDGLSSILMSFTGSPRCG
jgi:hypothetical protein